MIYPYTVGPAALSGFIWFQGEANAGNPAVRVPSLVVGVVIADFPLAPCHPLPRLRTTRAASPS